MYFLILRPQQRRAKEQRAMVQSARRGDVVVTSGGLIGKVTKSVDDTEVELEIAPNVRVRLARSGIADVRSKGEPVKDAPAAQDAAGQERRRQPLMRRQRVEGASRRGRFSVPMFRLAPWKVASILALVFFAALMIVPSFLRAGDRGRRRGADFRPSCRSAPSCSASICRAARSFSWRSTAPR